MSDTERCEGCGARLLTHPSQEEYSVSQRLEALGYVATDAYRDDDGLTTYHGHALDDPQNDHDGYGEVRQGHDDPEAHERARTALEAAPVRCARHWEESPAFTKSVAPTGAPEQLLLAQGKCPECEAVLLVSV